MTDIQAVAVVGLGAVMPDASDPLAFWNNIQTGRSSISEVSDERWRADLYYSADHSVRDKTYSKIGGWVRAFNLDAFKWGIAIPPRVLQSMDMSQQWAIDASRQALTDYGYPQRHLDPERVAVIIGNTLAGEGHYNSTFRIRLPEYMEMLTALPDFQLLPETTRRALLEGLQGSMQNRVPDITEDTMPGELPNIIAGRVANVFNFSGPNFITDAACASSLAAVQAAVDGLLNHQFDAVLTGGVDRNMGAESFVKFSKIGALSPDGSRPYADGANGFVMGEGCGMFLLKRLVDAEKDGDKIYAVIRGLGSSSDGRGKGITAPNPAGQKRAVERAWKNTGLNPATVGLIEGHGTSTRVGDVAEVNALNTIFAPLGLPVGSIALGSVKSNVGHLKSASGAAAIIKVCYALYEKKLPPSINFHKPNPNIDFAHMPFYVNTTLRPWEVSGGNIRRAGVSSFGFGGTNFHMVIEEHIPGLLTDEKRSFPAVQPVTAEVHSAPEQSFEKAVPFYRGLFFISAETPDALKNELVSVLNEVKNGKLPENNQPSAAALKRPERLAMDYSDAADLIKKMEKTLKVMEAETPAAWLALTAQAVYRGSGASGKVAFLFPGQGSQYVNMLRELRDAEPLVADVYREADAVMTPLLGRPLTGYIFADGDEASLAQAENDLKNTAITQPAMLTANVSILRLMQKFGYAPDLVIGHSLGEYAALVSGGTLSFGDALKIVSARGREMTAIKMADNGCMAAVSAPLAEVERLLKDISGYVVIANINSLTQSVIGGETPAVDAAIEAFQAAGYQAVKIPVSHAFHTRIVAPASEPLGRVIEALAINPPRVPVVANVTGAFYPTGRDEIIDMLKRQIASPVQFVKGIQTLYEQGARVFVEIGPKRVLSALASDILKDKKDVTIVATNHPRKGTMVSFNEALAALLAAGVVPQFKPETQPLQTAVSQQTAVASVPAAVTPQSVVNGRLPLTGSVVISGAGLGLPGREGAVFSDENVERLLKGQMLIEPFSSETRQTMLDKHVTRLVKSEAGAVLQVLDDLDQTVKLAGQRGQFDLSTDFGLPAERVDVYDISTQLAIAAGIEALRDAGIPLVMRYRQTSKGGFLPDRWMLPPALADETGVIFASAFPGLDRMAEESEKYHRYDTLKKQMDELRQVQALVPAGQNDLLAALERRIQELESSLAGLNYSFDRRYVFRVLTMGHSQFAEYIGARGPNGHVNAACASTTHAVGLAEDWIRAGRCRRVVIVAGDDVTSGSLPGWIGTSLMASGAATVEGDLRLAALPFDRRRNGMIMGMGAAGLVVESQDAVQERGMRAIAEVLSTQIANSAFHGTRLDVNHVSEVMGRLLDVAENRFAINRAEIAAQTVFVSHETYTPARGGSAAAEIHALRNTFGQAANRVVIANTKGYTGHTMGVGVEDVLAVKALEKGLVPPVAHIHDGFEPDPDLGDLNLSQGGEYPVQYALRLGAGFGSQIAMTLLRKISGVGERIQNDVYRRWLADVAGYEQAETEVVQRTLRICNQGEPLRTPAASRWSYGQVPMLRVAVQDKAVTPAASMTVVEEVVPVVAAAAPAAAETSSGLNFETVKSGVLAAVCEKTGYPAEMLDLELDLEADLGIDTVKQAELFATVRETYNIPRREDLRLSDYNTLTKVIQFVLDSLPQGAPAPATQAAVPLEEAPAVAPVQGGLDFESVKAMVLAAVSEKTGYPAEMLDLELDLEADLGIDTVKQAELFATVRETYNIPRREDLRLSDYNTLTKVIQFVLDSLPQGAPTLAAQAVQVAAAVEQQAAVSSAQSGVNFESVKGLVLAAVSEKTGYPAEMLDLELDLEADLGIDTVKQAELFATVRETYSIPRREDLRLSDYNTLNKVIQFVLGSLPQTSLAPAVQVAMTLEESPAAAPEQGGVNFEAVKSMVLAAVSEKTGYPAEMLDLELDLEADLGIDTVKQAELFATVRETYSIPRREDLRLSDYNTLNKVIQFVLDSLEVLNTAAAVVTPEIVEEPQILEETAPAAQEQSITRRVPAAVLRPRLDLCRESGLKLDANSRVLLVGDPGKPMETLARKLRARKVQVLTLAPLALLGDPQEMLKELLAGGPIQGVYFLGDLNPQESLLSMSFETWQAEVEQRSESLYHLFRTLTETSFLVCATRLGGLHAIQSSNGACLGGLVSGFAKALAQERPQMLVKVVDFETNLTAATLAEHLIAETLADSGCVEIGWKDGLRYGISLLESPAASQPDFDLPTGAVFVVSGGSGGIISPVVLDLARATQGTFFLLSRTHLPDPADPDLLRLKTDRQALLADVMQRLTAEGKKATPALAEQKLAALERAAATLETLTALQAAGAQAHYLVCDVTRPESVQAAVKQISVISDRVDVFIHAAGMERSRRLDSKPLDEFKQTIAVKAHGFFNLFKTLQQANLQPRALVFFGSVAGRFGNAGQVDYAAANDLLNKIAAALQHEHPAIKTVSIDWGAWAEVGMASRGHIPELMKLAGIEMISPAAGAPLVRAELLTGGGEVVLAGALGALEGAQQQDVIDVEKANQALTTGQPLHAMLSRLTGYDARQGLTLEAELDPMQEPFLKDHALNGIPVLPGVMGIEGFSVAARHITTCLAAECGDMEVAHLEDIHFMAPFKFYRDQSRRLTWKALPLYSSQGLTVQVTLESSMLLKTQTVANLTHFSGKVYLQPVNHKQRAAAKVQPPAWNGGFTVSPEDIYRLYFHGPAFQVLDGVQSDGRHVIGRLNNNLPPFTREEQPLLSMPLLLELCFQTAGIWEAGTTGVMALPESIGSLTLYHRQAEKEPLYAEVSPRQADDGSLHFDARVVDGAGRLYLQLEDYRTVALPYAVEQKLLAPLQHLAVEKN